MRAPFNRDVQALASHTFDLLVIGGGIYGLTTACDAAQRGLRVALVERNDFGSGTSFNHLRTIHGGLRYLQTLDVARARESVRERRTLARIAPWAVSPVPFVLPLHRSLTRGPQVMRAGFLLDALVASDRNQGVAATHQLPAGRVISADAARRSYPELQATDFTAAAVWYDYITTDADRLTLSWALAAAQAGATLANYVAAEELTVSDGRVTGAIVADRQSGERVRIEARTVVNATGAAVNRLLHRFHSEVSLPLLQAMNVVTTRPAPSAAIGGRSTSGRNLFVVPWQGRALFGTWESASTCPPDALGVDPGSLTAFIAELNQAFPAFRLTQDDVSLVHRGVVPARVGSDGTLSLDGRELVFEHRPEGLMGVVSVAGTKYTTARAVAERIVDRLMTLLGRSPVPSRSASIPLPHVDFTGDALLRHAAAHEMVQTLADAVMRRTPTGALGRPDEGTLAHAAQIVGEELGWSADRQRDEIEALRSMY
jgi:glycerol-3-phosphate dehydrogenase